MPLKSGPPEPLGPWAPRPRRPWILTFSPWPCGPGPDTWPQAPDIRTLAPDIRTLAPSPCAPRPWVADPGALLALSLSLSLSLALPLALALALAAAMPLALDPVGDDVIGSQARLRAPSTSVPRLIELQASMVPLKRHQVSPEL